MLITKEKLKLGNLVELPEHQDARGKLCFVESHKHLPFSIERSFWVYGTPSNTIRGQHAHRQSGQAHVCLHGSATIELDNGSIKEKVVLNKPNLVLILGPMIWHSFTLTEGSSLLVFTSDWYDPRDYIRDYNEFLLLTKGAS